MDSTGLNCNVTELIIKAKHGIILINEVSTSILVVRINVIIKFIYSSSVVFIIIKNTKCNTVASYYMCEQKVYFDITKMSFCHVYFTYSEHQHDTQ